MRLNPEFARDVRLAREMGRQWKVDLAMAAAAWRRRTNGRENPSDSPCGDRRGWRGTCLG